MVKEKKKFVLLSSLILSVSLSIGFLINSKIDNTSIRGYEKSQNYEINFNSSKNKLHSYTDSSSHSGEATIRTDLGNNINFVYDKAKGSSTSWHIFASNGYFYNNDPINGLESISLSFGLNNANFTIYYSCDKSFDQSHSFVSSTTEATIFDFDGYMPNYFMVENKSGLNLNITSMNIKLSCSNNYSLLSLSTNNDSYGTVSGEGYKFIGNSVTISAEANSGYYFTGWYDNEDKLVSKSNPYTFTMPKNDISMYAVFEAESVYSFLVDCSSLLSWSPAAYDFSLHAWGNNGDAASWGSLDERLGTAGNGYYQTTINYQGNLSGIVLYFYQSGESKQTVDMTYSFESGKTYLITLKSGSWINVNGKWCHPAEVDEYNIEPLPTEGLEKTELQYDYSDYTYNSIYTISAAPVADEAKVLIIPVWFSDSSNFIAQSNKEIIRDDIRKAYLGTTEETGWHSVKTYYEEESKGMLTLDGTVSEWYNPGRSYEYYGSDTNRTVSLVSSATNWYFNNHLNESRKDYDKDENGYLDAVLLIYAAPNYISSGLYDYDNLWAYCYWVQDYSKRSTSKPGENVFFWASYDFMYDSSTSYERTGLTGYCYGDNSHSNVDAHTFIHEMGHVFGLNDYYDYGKNSYCPAGGFSMQDYNIGGHDPFSIMAYGWADPYIPSESCTITLKPFVSSHDLILLTPEWNVYDSPFDEYLLLELYTPTGLNEFDSTYAYRNGLRGPTDIGIRVWHVDARLVSINSLSSGYPVYSISNLTSDVYSGYYGVELAFSNSTESNHDTPLGSQYTKYDLLHLIRNDTSSTYTTTSCISNDDLFKDGSSFTMYNYRNQFANTGLLDSNIELGWSFNVSISGVGDNASATIELIRE